MTLSELMRPKLSPLPLPKQPPPPEAPPHTPSTSPRPNVPTMEETLTQHYTTAAENAALQKVRSGKERGDGLS